MAVWVNSVKVAQLTTLVGLSIDMQACRSVFSAQLTGDGHAMVWLSNPPFLLLRRRRRRTRRLSLTPPLL